MSRSLLLQVVPLLCDASAYPAVQSAMHGTCQVSNEGFAAIMGKLKLLLCCVRYLYIVESHGMCAIIYKNTHACTISTNIKVCACYIFVIAKYIERIYVLNTCRQFPESQFRLSCGVFVYVQNLACVQPKAFPCST